MRKISAAALSLILVISLSGCSLLGKKKIEDTETYRELMNQQKEIDRKMDSVRKENYRQMVDSAGVHMKKIDSLRHITDSLKQKLDKNIKDLKKNK